MRKLADICCRQEFCQKFNKQDLSILPLKKYYPNGYHFSEFDIVIIVLRNSSLMSTKPLQLRKQEKTDDSFQFKANLQIIWSEKIL